ncbi:MAG TPA: GNAT family N-acetyltransferase [Flavipsychrobacter sp.]|jgi:GNAT superfamily N-acetyltransferase|nr:GNAT family N-acetyltransferase [Flavipsychrobacter sp.]
MTETKIYNAATLPSGTEKRAILEFLSTHLEQYGDKIEDIEKAFDYALSVNNSAGGMVVDCTADDNRIGAAIINKTGMKGYIPENILVYIATHKDQRGKGIGKQIMNTIIENTDGDIALHVEPENPALHLYKKLGFTNKYLEMRLTKKGKD